MSQVNLDNLETITSEEVLKTHLKDIRDEAPDIRVVGNVINTSSNGLNYQLSLRIRHILWRQRRGYNYWWRRRKT